MGVYYIVENVDKHERLEPGKVDGGSIKASAVRMGRIAHLMAHLMIGKWSGDKVVIHSDSGDGYDDCRETCNDVTVKSIVEYNQCVPSEHAIRVCRIADDE